MKPVTPVVSLAGRKSYGELERENADLRDKLAKVRLAIADRRYGDALALTRPATVSAPIAAKGDQA